jgi:hypothetical protein
VAAFRTAAVKLRLEPAVAGFSRLQHGGWSPLLDGGVGEMCAEGVDSLELMKWRAGIVSKICTGPLSWSALRPQTGGLLLRKGRSGG